MKLTTVIARKLRGNGMTYLQIGKRFGVSAITASRRANGSVRTTVKLPSQACGFCKRTFQPKDSDQKYCKRQCLYDALRKPVSIYPKPSRDGYRIGHKWVDGKRIAIKEHREVLGLTDPKLHGHHRDRNKQNNAPSNLKIVTRSGHRKEHLRKWTKRETALLGEISDYRLAKQLRISPSAVFKKRKELGIKAWLMIEWTPKMDALLGTDFDLIIANRIGVSRAEVCRRRRRLDIPAKGFHPSHPRNPRLKSSRSSSFAVG